jgi:hypothetical protein
MTTQNTVGKIIIAVLLFFGLHGCSRDQPAPAKAGPDTTVTVEIVANISDDQRDQIREKLEGMLDAPRSSVSLRHRLEGNKLTFELSPVSDVQAFAKKIDFGKVTEVKDRRVKVELEK